MIQQALFEQQSSPPRRVALPLITQVRPNLCPHCHAPAMLIPDRDGWRCRRCAGAVLLRGKERKTDR